MTREDIIRMAREAGFGHLHAIGCSANAWGKCNMACEEQIERFAALVAADALMRYGWHDAQCPYMQDVADCTCGLHDAIAAAGGDVDEFIRKRGEP